MGILRIILALSVLLQHCGGGIDGYAMVGGSLAVQGFYIVSGFYMGMVLNTRYDRPALNRTFWLNRALRVYGTYYFFLALYLLALANIWWSSGTFAMPAWQTPALPGWERVAFALTNFTILGSDLLPFLHPAHGHLRWLWASPNGGGDLVRFLIILPSWTLAVELDFYLIAPFIARRRTWQIALLAVASLAARVATHGLVGGDDAPGSYKFFPFELCFFLLGVLGWRAYAARPEAWRGVGAKALMAFTSAAILGFPVLLGPHSYDAFFAPGRILVLSLIAISLPAIHAHAKDSALDRKLGNLSYPLYLGHSLVIFLLDADHGIARKLAAIAGSFLLAWMVATLVELPIEQVRRRITARAKGKASREEGTAPIALAA